MPRKGYRSITVVEEVYQKVRAKAEEEGKSVTNYASEILNCFLEADEKLSRYAPFVEIVGFEGNSIILKDHKKDRIVEVYMHKKELHCIFDDSQECMHVSFCHALPQVRKLRD